eukprot:CAMPEP_0119343822 /NCGR_PEP_ID=MMETSP1333-20130426/106652_1 /TAXON_ID=418940 /ORGANISM="Scyphosphaera apsteinii, Strain RCC1455" /LENGTH=267 /DNA_ID=CAMNT_0007356237 /DNA_START=598 /DNA_END=1400 /DNA_ORIENTATION=+
MATAANDNVDGRTGGEEGGKERVPDDEVWECSARIEAHLERQAAAVRAAETAAEDEDDIVSAVSQCIAAYDQLDKCTSAVATRRNCGGLPRLQENSDDKVFEPPSGLMLSTLPLASSITSTTLEYPHAVSIEELKAAESAAHEQLSAARSVILERVRPALAAQAPESTNFSAISRSTPAVSDASVLPGPDAERVATTSRANSTKLLSKQHASRHEGEHALLARPLAPAVELEPGLVDDTDVESILEWAENQRYRREAETPAIKNSLD